MDYVTVRELREQSGKVWERIEAGEEIVVTRNGKPFALLVHTEPAQVENALRAYRAARFGVVLERMQAQARESGASKLSAKAIQAEIDAVRAERAKPGRKKTTSAHAASTARRR